MPVYVGIQIVSRNWGRLTLYHDHSFTNTLDVCIDDGTVRLMEYINQYMDGGERAFEPPTTEYNGPNCIVANATLTKPLLSCDTPAETRKRASRLLKLVNKHVEADLEVLVASIRDGIAKIRTSYAAVAVDAADFRLTVRFVSRGRPFVGETSVAENTFFSPGISGVVGADPFLPGQVCFESRLERSHTVLSLRAALLTLTHEERNALMASVAYKKPTQQVHLRLMTTETIRVEPKNLLEVLRGINEEHDYTPGKLNTFIEEEPEETQNTTRISHSPRDALLIAAYHHIMKARREEPEDEDCGGFYGYDLRAPEYQVLILDEMLKRNISYLSFPLVLPEIKMDEDEVHEMLRSILQDEDSDGEDTDVSEYTSSDGE